jgi:hypothetical protein
MAVNNPNLQGYSSFPRTIVALKLQRGDATAKAGRFSAGNECPATFYKSARSKPFDTPLEQLPKPGFETVEFLMPERSEHLRCISVSKHPKPDTAFVISGWWKFSVKAFRVCSYHEDLDMSDSIHQPCALVHDILDARPLFGHDLQARKQK